MPAEEAVQQVNRDVLKLWADEFRGRENAIECPLLYGNLKTNGLLFIGCNPALPKSKPYEVPPLGKVLNDENLVDKLTKAEVVARSDYPYYKPCHNIAKKLGLTWVHIDWFFKRGTSQKELQVEYEESFAEGNDSIEMPKFYEKQIALSQQLMNACTPKMILVMNAFASKIARSQFNLSTELDADGLLWGTVGNNRVPFFLSSMLTGQRALDLGSRQRLEWHMLRTKQIIERHGDDRG